MRKLVATVSLGTLLVAGFLFAQDSQPADLSMDREPTVYSIGNTSLF